MLTRRSSVLTNLFFINNNIKNSIRYSIIRANNNNNNSFNRYYTSFNDLKDLDNLLKQQKKIKSTSTSTNTTKRVKKTTTTIKDKENEEKFNICPNCLNIQHSLKNKHTECFKGLVKNDKVHQSRDDSPVQVAVVMQDVDMLKQLITEEQQKQIGNSNTTKELVNYVNRVGFTALHYCSMTMMMERDKNLTDNHSYLTKKLHFPGSAKQLAERKNEDFKKSVDAGERTLAIVDLLLNAGADIHILTPTNVDAFGIAAETGLLSLCKRLVKAGAKINRPNIEGDTPLMTAIANQNTDVVEFLISIGADLDYINEINDENAFQRAGFYTFVPVLKLLIKAGAKDRDRSNTALHYTVSANQKAATKLLLQHQPEAINFRDIGGTSPIFLAVQSSYSEMIKYLLDNGARVDYVVEGSGDNLGHVLAFSGKPSDMKVLESGGISVKSLNATGETPLHEAARGGNAAMLRFLVRERGLDVNQKNNNDETPLSLAVSHRKLGGAKELLELGANPNIPNQDRRYPIHYAAEVGLPKMVALLAEYGANINIENSSGMTPLMLSIERKNKACHDILLSLTRQNIES